MGKVLSYLLSRLREPSSYAGLAGLFGLLGLNLGEVQVNAIVQGLIGIASALALLLKDNGATRGLLLPLALAGTMGLTACTPSQRASVQTYQDRIAAACAVAMQLAPLAPPIAPWIVGGCSTEATIAKLALDPGSLAWVDGLIKDAKQGK